MKQRGQTFPRFFLTAFFLALVLAGFCSAAAAGRLILPANTVRIEDETFYSNRSLDEVQLPEKLEYIGHKAFAKSTIHYLYIPKSVTMIEEDAFDSCEGLVCLVPKDSYALKWCRTHDIPYYDTNYVESITVSEKTVMLKNGAGKKIKVTTQPQGAVDRLLWVSSDKDVLTVDKQGNIFGKYPGKARIVVSSRDGSVTARISVKVQANYRAVLFSESTFDGRVIKRNRGDVRLMKEMLAAVTGPDGGAYTVSTYDDLSAGEVYQKIQEHLIAPSRDGDVSMFFFASHGDYRSTNEQYAGRLWCKNRRTWVELPTLARTLSKAKGKVIVLLESCGPGAALHDFRETGDEITDDPDGAGELVSAFSSADPGLEVYEPAELPETEETDRKLIEEYLEEQARPDGSGTAAKGSLFKTEKFIVMTASAYRQISYTVGTDTYNLFPTWLTRGVGTGGSMPADTECGNGNGKLTLRELYEYVYKHTVYKQTPQVYPEDSGYVLFIRAE